MIGIYLCDDDDAVRHQIQSALEWKILVENYDMKVLCSASHAQELLSTVENGRRGIYFLDVELRDEDWDGFRLGRREGHPGQTVQGHPVELGHGLQILHPGLGLVQLPLGHRLAGDKEPLGHLLLGPARLFS